MEMLGGFMQRENKLEIQQSKKQWVTGNPLWSESDLKDGEKKNCIALCIPARRWKPGVLCADW